MKPKFLSVIIPAYNEEKRIEKTLIKILAYLKKKEAKFEIIVVDDGSTDNTINKIIKVSKDIIIIKNPCNMGKGYSVKSGMLHCKGDYALFTDADLSTPIEEIEKFLAIIPEYDIILGSRRTKESNVVEKQTPWRIMAGNIFPFLVSFFINLKIKDTQCGFKLFNMKKSRKIFKKQKIFGFGFDVEILFLANKYNLKIKEIGVEWYNDSSSKVRLFKDSFSMLFELIKIRLNDFAKKY